MVANSVMKEEKEQNKKELHTLPSAGLGFVELWAKILPIMRNDFRDYVRTFANYVHLFRFCITRSLIQDRQNSLPPSSKNLDFLYCLARSAALTLAE